MTISLEADEFAVGMINLRVFKAHSSWSFTISTPGVGPFSEPLYVVGFPLRNDQTPR